MRERPPGQFPSATHLKIAGLVVLAIANVVLFALATHRFEGAANPATSVGASPLPSTDPTIIAPAGPVPSVAGSVSPAPTGTDTLANVRSAISAEGASVLVFGDGSGNESDEWVAVWAGDHLATTRKVTYTPWSSTSGVYETSRSFGSTGDSLSLWNASTVSPDMRTEPTRVADAWQAADVVLLSYGHRRAASEVADELTAILDAVREQDASVQVAVIVQNPDPTSTEHAQRATTQAVQEWADGEGLPTIDVYQAFLADPSPRSELVEDDGSPTAQGSRLFALTVEEALQ